MRRNTLAVCAVLLFAACDIEPKVIEPDHAIISRDVVQNFTIGSFANPCGEGTITVAGTVVITQSETVNSNGLHSSLHIRSRDVTATGTDGSTYRATGGLNTVLYFSDVSVVQTAAEMLNLRNDKPGSGIVVQSLFHTTIKDGQPVVTVTHENVQCTGN